MKVYILKPLKDDDKAEIIQKFHNTLVCQLREYGVECVEVEEKNMTRILISFESNSIVIVYNDNDKLNKSEFSMKFLEKANSEKADIWPVAIDRENRVPEGILSNKQSYDVGEQLRCRGLDENYIDTIAKLFSRKIIANVYPTWYSESGEVFLSHKRLDGEDITAKIYDKMIVQVKSSMAFRDVVDVNVGEEAQAEIDKSMQRSDVFVFIHTEKSVESEWILKELRYALLRQVPILWIQIDNADISKLKVKPSDEPHMKFSAEEFYTEPGCTKIVDEILQRSFELIMERSNKAIEYVLAFKELFGEKLEEIDNSKNIYHVSVDRKGYRYPQRKIEQYFQVFGRTPLVDDAKILESNLGKNEKDSILILTNRIVSKIEKENVILDTLDDFYYTWAKYLNREKNADKNKDKNMEIILSGAFPDGDEIYKQSLIDALILFAKAIIRNGYTLTFGAHPTFQELFFDIAEELDPVNHKNKLKMYISEYFLNDNSQNDMEYNTRCTLCKTDKKETIELSLTELRKKMIQRDEVKAVVCLGGKVKTDKSKEGIREEIDIAREYEVPVFIVGSVGGCSSIVATEYKESGWEKLNNAPSILNDNFFSGIDYFQMAQKMIEFIEGK